MIMFPEYKQTDPTGSLNFRRRNIALSNLLPTFGKLSVPKVVPLRLHVSTFFSFYYSLCPAISATIFYFQPSSARFELSLLSLQRIYFRQKFRHWFRWNQLFSMALLKTPNFSRVAQVSMKKEKYLNSTQFRSFFGVDPAHCEIVWSFICRQCPSHDLNPKYMLWGLMFLKIYETEEVHSLLADVTRKTFRFWSWRAIEIISNLEVVSFTFFNIFMIFLVLLDHLLTYLF